MGILTNRFFFASLLVSVAIGLLCLAPLQAQQNGAVKKRIEPAGIDGSLILTGKNDIPLQAIERFISLSGGKKARLVIVQTTEKMPQVEGEPLDQLLLKAWGKDKVAGLTLLRITTTEQANDSDLISALQTATGVWFCGSITNIHFLVGTKAGKSCGEVLKRGGVVAGSEGGAGLLAELQEHPLTANLVMSGLGLLPDSLVGFTPSEANKPSEVARALKTNHGKVGYELDPQVAMLVQGRKILALGKGKVTIHLAGCDFKKATQIVLEGKNNQADLTALRNAAQVRCEKEFPPKNPDPPVVGKGTLVIIGGGGMPKGLAKKFVELAGGDKARIVVLPTAMPDPIPKNDFMAEAFKKYGAQKVTVLPGRKISEVESDEYIKAMSEATGIWFGGGRQWRFVDAYLDTKLHPLMHKVLANGGVIGGSSAGASIQAEYMARGGAIHNFDIMAEGYEKGLCFLKGCAVDQHFSQRKRQKDMTSLIKTYPQLLGIGIDEATAIIVQGHVAEVVGNGKVHFYDSKRQVKNGEPDYEAIADGGTYDLKARKVLKQGHGK